MESVSGLVEMVESAVRELTTKNLAKMLEFLDSLVKSASNTSKLNRAVDDAEVIKLLQTLKTATESIADEVALSQRDRHALDARRCVRDVTLPKILAELDIGPGDMTAPTADQDGGARQRVVAEMCIQQAEQFRRRALHLEREMAALLLELETIRHMLKRQQPTATAVKDRALAR